MEQTRPRRRRPEKTEHERLVGVSYIEELTANGMIGAWKDRDDIGDSVEFAQKLRERVWTRTHE